MAHFYRRQPPRGTKVARGSPLGKSISAHFLFNGDFRSAVRGETGNPIASGGPKIVSGPNGQYALGNGSGKVTTNLYASDLGMAGAAPRSFVVEFDLPDSATQRNLFSFGDGSSQTRSMNALQVSPGIYRAVRFDTYGNDIQYVLHNVGGTATRVFLCITVQGTTVIFRSYSYLYSTGQVIYNTQTSTLGGLLSTGNTAPLNLMGGGAYNFTSLASALYYLSMYGGRVLTSAEFDQLYRDRHQVMDPPRTFPYAALSASSVPADTSLTGSAAAVTSAWASLSTSVQLAGASTGTAAASSALLTVVQLTGTSSARADASTMLSTAITLSTSTSVQSEATCSLSTGMPLAASAFSPSASSAALSGTSSGMIANSASSSGAVAALLAKIGLSTSAVTATKASAALEAGSSMSMAASSPASARAALATRVDLVAASATPGGATAVLVEVANTMGAQAASPSASYAALTSAVALAAAAGSALLATADLLSSVPLVPNDNRMYRGMLRVREYVAQERVRKL